SNGREGIKIFENIHIDLILTDIYMPDMDGLGVLLKLKEIDSNVKIIAMSGGSKRLGQEFLNFTKAFGAHFAIKKPFSNDELLLSIKSLLTD
ncbi:MAG: response regulator, partial [Magnetococcus sp. XQGC-1]